MVAPVRTVPVVISRCSTFSPELNSPCVVSATGSLDFVGFFFQLFAEIVLFAFRQSTLRSVFHFL